MTTGQAWSKRSGYALSFAQESQAQREYEQHKRGEIVRGCECDACDRLIKARKETK